MNDLKIENQLSFRGEGDPPTQDPPKPPPTQE